MMVEMEAVVTCAQAGQLTSSCADKTAVCFHGFTFLDDVDDRVGSQSVVQRNGDQRVCVTCELADGPLHADTNTKSEQLQIQKPFFGVFKRILVAPH